MNTAIVRIVQRACRLPLTWDDLRRVLDLPEGAKLAAQPDGILATWTETPPEPARKPGRPRKPKPAAPISPVRENVP